MQQYLAETSTSILAQETYILHEMEEDLWVKARRVEQESLPIWCEGEINCVLGHWD